MKILRALFAFFITAGSFAQAMDDPHSNAMQDFQMQHPTLMSEDFQYFEHYRAKRDETTVYIHVTMHTRAPSNNPPALNTALRAARTLFVENMMMRKDPKGENTSTFSEAIVKRVMKSETDLDWLSLFKTHPVSFDESTGNNLYDVLCASIQENLAALNANLSVDAMLSAFSPYGILSLTSAALNKETSNPTASYEAQLFNDFKASGKPVTLLESPHEIAERFSETHDESIEVILRESCDKPEEFLKLISNVVVYTNENLKFSERVYKSGGGALFRRLLPQESTFIDGRTHLWFGKFFEETPEEDINEGLFSMGAGHAHSLIDDTGNPIQPGFLRMLEEKDWSIENLSLEGTWKQWSTLEHSKYLERFRPLVETYEHLLEQSGGLG